MAYNPKAALNAVCPYYTMFPLEYPLRVLGKHKRKDSIVMDPFCGRGTSLFAARMLGMGARGIDVSPVAVAIAQAKLCKVDVDATVGLARDLINTTTPTKIPETPFFEYAYDAEVLRQLCALREGLASLPRETEASVLLRAVILGCLHGPKSKRLKEQAYFSNQMPRTFASKPNYSVRFWKRRRVKPPKADVVAVIERKLARIRHTEYDVVGSFKNVRLADARYASSTPPYTRDYSIVVTSPPYYGMRTYIADQWLRNWFLGGPPDVEYSGQAQLDHSGHDAFVQSLARVWANMSCSNAPALHMYIRFGVVPSIKSDAKRIIRESLTESDIPWRVVSVRGARSSLSGKRQAAQMAQASEAIDEYDFHVVRE